MFRRALVLGGLLAVLPVASRAELAMLVEGVAGPSTTLNHVGWFDVESVSWAIERGNPTKPQSFVVVLRSSAAVSTLMQASASGTSVKKVVLDSLFVGGVNPTLMLDTRLTCEDPLILEFSAALPRHDREQVSLSFQCGKLTWEKFDYNSNGQPLRQGKGSWNFRTNTP